MAVQHATGISQALQRVFMLPCLPPTSVRAAGRSAPLAHTFNSHRPHARHNGARSLHSSSIRLARPSASKQEIRSEKWDEEITSKLIYLIDPETNGLLRQPSPSDPEGLLPPEPRTRFDILKSLDRQTHRLVQFGQEHEGLPVCKIVSKKAEYERSKKQKEVAKEKKKYDAAAKSLKTLELNWAMDPNDLAHRLDKVEEFLSEGRKVEIVLASKKRGRKASPEECADVLRKIRQRVEGVEGAKEGKAMEGKVGGFATLFFQGRVVQANA